MVALLMAHGRMSAVLFAQRPVRVQPLFAVTQTYDSNVVSSSTRPSGDFVTRLSPGVEAEYRSALTRLLGRYTVDLERFALQPALTTADGRHAALADLRFSRSRRLSAGVEAAFTRTHTPSELGTVTGLIMDRALAERVEVRPSLVRQLDPVTSGTIEYTFTAERLAGGGSSRVHRTAAGLDRLLSRRDLLGVDYEMRRWFFQPGGHPTSHVLRLGWSRPITRLLDVELHAGPALTDGRTAPELAASMRHSTRPADLAIGYARTQTTIVGLPGVADTQSVSASASVRPRSGLELRVSPGVSRTTHARGPMEGWRLALDAERQLRRTLMLRISYEATAQRSSLAALSTQAVSRHLMQVSLLAVPRQVTAAGAKAPALRVP
ncbi:MAG TPA: hypothetical protein VIX63_14315 [Vicinamibacterales bacterium]